MKDFTFSFPTRAIFGRGAEDQAGSQCAPYGPNVMLLYGSERIRRSGLRRMRFFAFFHSDLKKRVKTLYCLSSSSKFACAVKSSSSPAYSHLFPTWHEKTGNYQ